MPYSAQRGAHFRAAIDEPEPEVSGGAGRPVLHGSWSVNGQIVPEELIRRESARIGRDRQWLAITDEQERARRLRIAAERSAADQLLLSQIAAADPRPVDPATVDAEAQRLRSQRAGGSSLDPAMLRRFVEQELRVQRITAEMVASASKPTSEQVESFYRENCSQFQKPEMFHAAHIVKHVNGEQSEAEAEAGIRAALEELERGEPFAEVADRHSDCKGQGGDLGQFPAGHMVQEFEDAIRALKPGQRTGVFKSPFGFHIAELRDAIPAGPASFDDVRTEIERVMYFANRHEAYMRAMDQLRSRADIRWVSAPDSTAA